MVDQLMDLEKITNASIFTLDHLISTVRTMINIEYQAWLFSNWVKTRSFGRSLRVLREDYWEIHVNNVIYSVFFAWRYIYWTFLIFLQPSHIGTLRSVFSYFGFLLFTNWRHIFQLFDLLFQAGMRTRFWPGLCTSDEGRFSKVFQANILDSFKSHLFC